MNYLWRNPEGLEIKDLFEVYPAANVDYDWSSGAMRAAEEATKSQMIEMGYTINGEWFCGEKDSFGPLSRCLVVEKDGDRFVVCYG